MRADQVLEPGLDVLALADGQGADETAVVAVAGEQVAGVERALRPDQLVERG